MFLANGKAEYYSHVIIIQTCLWEFSQFSQSYPVISFSVHFFSIAPWAYLRSLSFIVLQRCQSCPEPTYMMYHWEIGHMTRVFEVKTKQPYSMCHRQWKSFWHAKKKKKYRYRFQVRNFLRKIGLDVSCIPCSALNFSKRKKITIFRFCLFCIHPYVITSFILNSNGCISQVVSLCLTKLKPGWEKNLCGYIISPLIPLFFFFFFFF